MQYPITQIKLNSGTFHSRRARDQRQLPMKDRPHIKRRKMNEGVLEHTGMYAQSYYLRHQNNVTLPATLFRKTVSRWVHWISC